MCGGCGTRMWPESRESLPKQFIPRIGQRSTFQTIVSVVGDSSVFDLRWSSPITTIVYGSLSNCGRSALRPRSCLSRTGAIAPPPSSAPRSPGRLRTTRRPSSPFSPPTICSRTENNSPPWASPRPSGHRLRLHARKSEGARAQLSAASLQIVGQRRDTSWGSASTYHDGDRNAGQAQGLARSHGGQNV
jgi:hypothetical protein